MRALTAAPAHMAQGSSVTTSVASVRRHDPRACGRVAQGQDLGVGGRVVAQLALVVAAGHHLAVDQHHRADGHVAVDQRGPGLLEGQRHGGVVIHGGRH